MPARRCGPPTKSGSDPEGQTLAPRRVRPSGSDPLLGRPRDLAEPRRPSGSNPFARATAPANTWPGTTESRGASSGIGGSGTGSSYAAPSTSDDALPLATTVAPASRCGPPTKSGSDPEGQTLEPRRVRKWSQNDLARMR